MRIIVTGCRDWTDGLAVVSELAKEWRYTESWELKVGDCPTGADRFAREWFRDAGIGAGEGCMRVFSADWATQGRSAGPKRNQRMVDSGADLCLAFWDGESRGTLDCLTRCVKADIPVRIIPKGAK